MGINRHIKVGDNPDITKERSKATFDTNEMTIALYGKDKAEQRRSISQMVASHPALVNETPLEFLCREKKIEVGAKKVKTFVELVNKTNIDDDRIWFHIIYEVFGCDGFPLNLHMGMFLPALIAQADDALASAILPRANAYEIIGTYAQTEMGHGTNLRALETTATYDKEKHQFIIHTPTTSGTKWWPGNLGKFANYSVVAAQLIIDKKCYGTHNFLVQLRDERSHEPLEGITVGDIGPKMAYNSLDNGFLAFDHVRIPREHMLMKHAKVSHEGIYTPPQHAKIGYSAMVHVRAQFPYNQGHLLAVAATVATRYSAIRRQGEIKKGRGEVQILDYQTQQYRVFPQIARAYAYMFTGIKIKEDYARALEEIDRGNMTILPELHAITSGIKSVVSYEVGKGIEQCRMACGGHGYSAASGLPNLYGVQIGAATYEGENLVMLQQLGRYIIKAVGSARKGGILPRSLEYLGKASTAKSSIGMSGADELESILSSIEHAARRLAIDSAEGYWRRMEEGQSEERAWVASTVDTNRTARIHTRLFILRTFADSVRALPSSSTKSALVDLLWLFIHYEAVDMAQHLMEDGHCSGAQMKHLKQRLYEDLEKVRQNAVSFVDSFELSDRNLNSVLGKRDGNVYEALFDWAKNSELNHTEVLPAITKYIKPMQQAQSKL